MIQIQISIHIPADGEGRVQVNRLRREDANDDETIIADVFYVHYEEMIREMAALLEKQGIKTTFEQIGGDLE